MFFSVQLLRYFAAMFVVLVHSMDELDVPSVGHFGVDIFFVISGFVLTWNWKPKPFLSFLADRFFRIFPLYFLASLLFFFCKPFFFEVNLIDEFLFFLKSIFFIPSFIEGLGLQAFFPVGWSLMYEMLFYTALASTVWVKGRGARFLFLCCIFGSFSLLSFLIESRWLSFLGNLILWEFLLGVLLSLTLQGRVWHPLDSFVKKNRVPLLLVILAYLFLAHQINAHRLFIFGVPAFGLLYVVLQFEPNFSSQRSFLTSLYKLLGDISYAIYLTHPFVLWALYRLIGIAQLSVVIQFFTVVTSATLVGYFVWAMVEMPIARLIKTHRGEAKISVGAST